METTTRLSASPCPTAPCARCRPGRRRSRSRPSIGPRLAKDAVGAELDGQKSTCASRSARAARSACSPSRAREAGEFIRHSAEHVLADAVKRLWPEAEIDAGRKDHSEKFQYDFRFPRAFTPEDLEKIEEKMREILAEGERLRAHRGHPRGGRADLPRDGRDPEGRAPRRTSPRARRSPSTATAASPTSAAGRTCRALLADRRGQAARGLRRLLAGRRGQRAAAAHLRHRLRQPRRSWTSTWRGSRRPGRATTAGSARSSTSSASTRWRRPCRSSIPRARPSTTG